jgi:kynurenine formamidase
MSILIDSLANTFSSVIKEGVVYEVGFQHGPGIPHHPNHPPFLYSMARMHDDLPYAEGMTSANDIFTTGAHTGTHMDALGHVSCNGLIHGDISAEETQDKVSGLSKHSIDEASPIIKRGILLDVAGYKNVSHLEAGYAIGEKDLKETMEHQGVELEKGDAVLIRTGWGQFYKQPKKYVSVREGTPGINVEGAEWLIRNGMGLAGGDTIALEVTPTHSLPVHKKLLIENGIHIIEVMNLEEIAASKVYSFLFICLPLRIVGGTGSPVRPIAIS